MLFLRTLHEVLFRTPFNGLRTCNTHRRMSLYLSELIHFMTQRSTWRCLQTEEHPSLNVEVRINSGGPYKRPQPLFRIPFLKIAISEHRQY